LQLGARTIRLAEPQIMGILNVTPDSFSDGGRHDPAEDGGASAAEHGTALSAAGAAIIDVGGESTRPGAKPLWEGDEAKRVVPVIERLARAGTAVSIDTRKAQVMQDALAAGASMINDVAALAYDDRATGVAVAAGCPVVLMHAPSQSSDPHDRSSLPGGAYADAALDVFDWLEARIAAVVAAGVKRENIIADPGIGFGKGVEDNLRIIGALPLFHALGVPILFGASRKRLIGAVDGEAGADARLGGSIALALTAAQAGVQLHRVHDVPETRQALRLWRAGRDAALTRR
jgi:dihydropteroate synthase